MRIIGAPSRTIVANVLAEGIMIGVLSLPLSILAGTVKGPPIIGTLAGALNGTVSGVGLVLSGAVDLLQAAVPLAKTVAPFLVFL